MRAYAPASVTVVFAPADRGSLGVSMALEDGVEAAVSPADGPGVTLDGDPCSFEPVELALAALGVDARVDLTADVPVGCGFGASGAATLATCLAADEAFGLGYTRDELVDVAAQAEIAAGTGLGDVFVQHRGGLVYDTGEGRTDIDRTDEFRYACDGSIATESVLGDDAAMARIEAAGRDMLAEFDPSWSLATLFDRAWTFATATGLPTGRVLERVAEARDDGGAATMAMVGETVVASTEAAESVPNRTRIDPSGARLLD